MEWNHDHHYTLLALNCHYNTGINNDWVSEERTTEFSDSAPRNTSTISHKFEQLANSSHQKQLPINDQQQYLTQQCNNSSARLLFSVRARRQQPRYYGVYSVFYSRWPRLHFCATRSTTLATFYSLVEDSSLNLFPLTLWSP